MIFGKVGKKDLVSAIYPALFDLAKELLTEDMGKLCRVDDQDWADPEKTRLPPCASI